MAYTLKELLKIAKFSKRKIDGVYIPARPLNMSIRRRFKAAWLVLSGKADAVIWPGGQ